jgi:hypothetical protein
VSPAEGEVTVETPTEITTAGGLAGTLTDGTGISKITSSKFIKDFVVDLLMSVPPALVAANVGSVPQDRVALTTAAFALGGAVLGALYRAGLRWGTSASPTG